MLKILLKTVWHLICSGWRLIEKAHTVGWILEILGLSVTPSVIATAATAYYGEHSKAVLAVTFVLTFSLALLSTLAFLGYRLERTKRAQSALSSAPYDMTICEAALYVADSNPSWDAASDEVWAKLRQAARDGRITVWGRPESAHLERPYKPMEEIPPDHWRHYDFDFLRCMHSEDEVRCRSEPDDPKRHPLNKGYADLRVNTTQVRTLWVAKIP